MMRPYNGWLCLHVAVEERVDVGRHLEAALRASEQDFLREAEIQDAQEAGAFK